ncbi:hypothetical protein BLNAU_5246 [Blattamonas nauphoetae]|uniref:Uncharacterized protein n=1 Tax=Blattamonas nauphoetae TaxID=2049346 RepID=A0ABQ9Y7L6_9EUKA|nr:hypothetical protein BLNAU_5246 [Blattamonas nauphoetae]
MPPKHEFRRNLHVTQHSQRTERIGSSTSGSHIVHSPIPSSLEITNESPLDSNPIYSVTELGTSTVNERQYIKISKQILQYDMKLKRINFETISEQPHLEAHETALPTSITSDWRLVLQDSITIEDLRRGCISLFDQIDTDLPLSQTEMNHAVRFLEYATLHNQHRISSDSKLLETILSEDVCFQTNHSSALLKIVCHPSNTLRTVALSFLDASISNSFLHDFYFTGAVTRLLPQLLERLKPHEIPLNATTIKFHRHLISILGHFFSISSTEDVSRCLEIEEYPSDAEILQSEKLDAIFTPSFVYLRSFISAPVCPTDTLSGFILLSTAMPFIGIAQNRISYTIFPEVKRFFGEIRKDIVKELASMLSLSSMNEVELCLHSDCMDLKTVEPWLKGFEYLLNRVSGETQFSDLGTLAVALFMSNRPRLLYLIFHSDGKFGLEFYDKSISSSPLDTKSLWTLFTPTQPRHATILLTALSHLQIQ